MILMAGLVFLPVAAVGVLGAVVVAGHNLMDGQFWQLSDTLNERSLAWLWKVLYFGFASGPIDVLGMRVTVLYSLVPWIGVMALGYAFGPVMRMDAARRRRVCLDDRRRRDRALPRPARPGSLRRSQQVEPVAGPGCRRRGRREGPAADAPAPALAEHEQVPGLAALPAHDARAR